MKRFIKNIIFLINNFLKKEGIMAIIELNGFITGMSGKWGNVVISTDKNGIHARRYSKPSNPNTEKQREVRMQFSQLSKEWGKLTERQMYAWYEIARRTSYRKREKPIHTRVLSI